MTGEELNNLFQQARTEENKTSVQEVCQWIGSAAILPVGEKWTSKALIKKLLSKKIYLMISGLITTTTVISVLMYNTSAGKPDAIAKPVKKLPAIEQTAFHHQTAKQVKPPHEAPGKNNVPMPVKKAKASEQDSLLAVREAKEALFTKVSEEETSASGNTTVQAAENTTGSVKRKWLVKSGDLKIDTLFARVKTVEFISKIGNEVSVSAKESNHIHFSAYVAMEGKSKCNSSDTIEPEISYELSDSVLKIQFSENPHSFLKLFKYHKSLSHFSFEVPAHTNIKINNAFGDVVVKGIESDFCRVINGSGNTTIENVKAAVEVNNKFGDIKLQYIEGATDIESGSGEVDVSELKGRAKIRNKFGDISCEHITGDMVVTDHSGEISLKDIMGNIEAKNTFGDVTLRKSSGNVSVESSSGTVKGEEVELKEFLDVNSKFGDIQIQLKNKLEDLSFNLSSQFGDIRINKEGYTQKSDKEVFISKGKIKVKAKSASGSQLFE